MTNPPNGPTGQPAPGLPAYEDQSSGYPAGTGYDSAPAYESTPAYGEPVPTYGEPAPVYTEPAPVYTEPVPAFTEPAPVYDEPVDESPSKVDVAKDAAKDTAATAKDEAAAVKDTAVDAGKNVAATAKDRGQQRGERDQGAGQEPVGLGDQPGQGAGRYAAGQARRDRARLGQGARRYGVEVRGVRPDHRSAHQASAKVGEVAHFLENKEPGEVLAEVTRFARRRPGLFLVLCGAAGVLAGRVTRGAVAANTSVDSPKSDALDAPNGRRALETSDVYAAPTGPDFVAPSASLVDETPTAYDDTLTPGYSGGTIPAYSEGDRTDYRR